MEAFFENASDFVQNILHGFVRQWEQLRDEFSTRTAINIVLIIGGYIIVRPFFLKLFGLGPAPVSQDGAKKEAAKKPSKKPAKKAPAAVPKKNAPKQSRYGALSEQVEVSDDTASDDSDTKPATAEAKQEQKTRRRQRRLLRAKLDEAKMRKFEEAEWDDPDITDLMPPSSK